MKHPPFDHVSRYASSVTHPKGECRGHIVLVDDDPDIHDIFEVHLVEQGYMLTAFADAGVALGAIREEGFDFDVLVSDLKMPGVDGLELVSEVRKLRPDTPILLITAHGSIDSAVEAIRRGATDYILKPLNLDQLSLVLERNVRYRRIQQDNYFLKREIEKNWKLDDILGKSQAMQSVFDVIRRVSQSSASVLITGESGTGKEMVARALHHHSPRRAYPFVAVNCAAIPENLLESELFGHRRGAFTGATETRSGLFREAHRGTLFLDEIGEMPMGLQAKLLRVLQDKRVRPVGDNRDVEVDVRIVAATHCNLRQAIRNGRFREDLYFRLSVIPVELPSLRSRREDIPLLAQHFLRKFATTNGKNLTGFTPEAMSRLLTSRWEGNVRQLQNVVERAVIMSRGEVIEASDILMEEPLEREPVGKRMFARLPSLAELEKDYIEYVLLQTEGHKEKAASILGINRKTLYRKERELRP